MDAVRVFHQKYHMQGFVCDGSFFYWSFTDCLIKTSRSGEILLRRAVPGGHLGDITFRDGKIYGSFLGSALPGHVWDDWTSFQILMFDAEDLRLIQAVSLPVCDDYKRISGTASDERGFNAIDGIAFGREPGSEKWKLFVACALLTGEQYADQILLQCSSEGKYETEYRIPTGNTVYGIQNLDYDTESGCFWFSTYEPERDFQPRETLYCVDAELRFSEQYRYSSPYGFQCLGGRQFLCSSQGGVNGDRYGTVYRCGQEAFRQNLCEDEIRSIVDR